MTYILKKEPSLCCIEIRLLGSNEGIRESGRWNQEDGLGDNFFLLHCCLFLYDI